MEGIDNLHVFIGYQIPLIGTPLVIAALSFNERGDCECERYCFVYDFKKASFIADDLTNYVKADIEDSEILGDPAAFLNKMIVDDSNYFADRAIYEMYVQSGYPSPPPIELIKSNFSQVDNIWRTGKFKNEIETINRDTNCSELRRFLNKTTKLSIFNTRVCAAS